MTESTALRALGIVGGEPLVRLMQRLRDGDAALEDDLRAMERASAMLALTAQPVELPADLKRRVLSRISADGYYFLRERDSDWEPAGVPESYVRRLYIDSRGDAETRLVRILPSAPPNALADLAGQGFYLISGDLNVEGSRFEIGDTLHAPGAPLVGKTEHGCVLFAITTNEGSRSKSPVRVAVRAAEGEWREEGEGVFLKHLTEDRDRGRRWELVRMEPGAIWGARHQPEAEEIFLLRGDWRCLGRNLHPGDYYRSAAGIEQEATTSPSGCKMILVKHIRAE